jgi:hypothetical protein
MLAGREQHHALRQAGSSVARTFRYVEVHIAALAAKPLER